MIRLEQSDCADLSIAGSMEFRSHSITFHRGGILVAAVVMASFMCANTAVKELSHTNGPELSPEGSVQPSNFVRLLAIRLTRLMQDRSNRVPQNSPVLHHLNGSKGFGFGIWIDFVLFSWGKQSSWHFQPRSLG